MHSWSLRRRRTRRQAASRASSKDETDAVVPGATVQLTGPSVEEVQFTDAAGEFWFQNVPPGTYQLSVTLSGFTDVTLDQVVVADAEVSVSPIQLTIAGIGETVVVSASRAESALIDAPATMTVISGESFEASAAQNYGDVLRTVPGVNVVQLSARDVNLTSRQATNTLATSELTLVDGRSSTSTSSVWSCGTSCRRI